MNAAQLEKVVVAALEDIKGRDIEVINTAKLTPLFAGIVAYTFFGLAEVTEELTHPFGPTANALPLDAICRAVEISLAPHLNEPAPPPLAPVAFRLD